MRQASFRGRGQVREPGKIGAGCAPGGKASQKLSSRKVFTHGNSSKRFDREWTCLAVLASIRAGRTEHCPGARVGNPRPREVRRTSAKSPVSSNDPRPTCPQLKVRSITEKRGEGSASTNTSMEPEWISRCTRTLCQLCIRQHRRCFHAGNATARSAIHDEDSVVNIHLGARIDREVGVIEMQRVHVVENHQQGAGPRAARAPGG